MTQAILRMRYRMEYLTGYRMRTIPLRFLWGVPINVAGLAVLLQSAGSNIGLIWSQLEPGTAQALQASFLAGGATGLGALGVLTFKRGNSLQAMFGFLALSAGAMFSAALLSLILPAIRMTDFPVALDVLLAFALGYAAMAALDKTLPHVHAAPRESGAWPADSVRLMVIAIAVHNLPEGFAVGVGFGGGDTLGLSTALSIGMQNIPEGLVVATALWSIGISRTNAFAFAVATGLLEPLGAAMGLFAVGASAAFLPWALAGSAGAMMFVIAEELLPEALKGISRGAVKSSFAAGALGMTALLTVF